MAQLETLQPGCSVPGVPPGETVEIIDVSRQPLRYVLADDPRAGKTIMAGLFIKKLIARGDLARCLIVSPGVLVEQWQDELDQKSGLAFDIQTNDALEPTVSTAPPQTAFAL